MRRNMVWHELFDRMKNNYCPICELIHNRTMRSMDGFLYESVNDVDLRKNINKSNGLCNYHAYMLMDMGDPLAHSLIYSDLLDKAIHEMSATVKKQKDMFQSHDKCLFCKQAKESEDSYINTFANAFEDTEFKQKYSETGLLCLPHLEIISTLKIQSVDKIIDITLNKYNILKNDLLEIKRKNDYRYSHEEWTEQEKSACKRVVEVINAKKGIRK